MNTDFIEKLKKIDELATKYDDITGGFVDTVRSESGVLSAEKMQEEIASIVQENRLLSIGIIGRVKAGKSSLLNSLFFDGKEILPKAATPMTAALTIIKYAEKPYAEVDLFTSTDVAEIKKEHDDFVFLRDKKIKETLAKEEEKSKKEKQKEKKSVDKAKIERMVDRELSENPKQGSWDQYERMLKSGKMASVYGSSFSEKKKLDATTLDDLMGKLSDYVSANGQYMPFTKDVVLYLDIPELKDIQIVDTPGVNDPVKSREKRTEDYLGQCDVVFVVSPAGDFLSQNDLDLMAHVSGKKGVNYVYLVASRSDQQLYGSIKENAQGSFTQAVNSIRLQLSSQARDVFTVKKGQNPESSELYDSLINNMDKRVVITSSICQALLQHINDKSAWDEDMDFAWSRLNEEYPDYFSSSAAPSNLELISGVNTVKNNIADVRTIKDDIIKERQEEYISKQSQNVENFFESVKKAVQESENRLREADAEKLKKNKAQKEKLRNSASVDVDEAFDEALYNFKSELSITLKQNSRNLFDDVEDFSKYEKEETKTQQVRHTRKKGLGFIAFITGGRHGVETYYTTETYTVRTIQTAPIKRKLNDVIQDLQDDLETCTEKAVLEWKKSVQSKTISALRNSLGDDSDEDIDIPLLKMSIRKVVENMKIPKFSLSTNKFTGEYSGILKDDDIDKFLDACADYVNNLRSVYSAQIRTFLNEMESSAKKEKLSSLLFGKMDEELSELEKQIQTKEAILQRYESCLSELQALSA